MKRITIRRKKKEAPTPPPQPPKVEEDNSETSEYTSSDDNTQNEPPTKQFANLKTQAPPVSRPKVHFQEPSAPVRSARNVERQSFPAQPTQKNSYNVQRPPANIGRPRPMVYDRPQRKPRGRQKWRFRSIYGPNAHLLSTQDKARRLYYAAFG